VQQLDHRHTYRNRQQAYFIWEVPAVWSQFTSQIRDAAASFEPR